MIRECNARPENMTVSEWCLFLLITKKTRDFLFFKDKATQVVQGIHDRRKFLVKSTVYEEKPEPAVDCQVKLTHWVSFNYKSTPAQEENWACLEYQKVVY